MARLGSAVLLCAYFVGGSKSGAGKRSGQNPLRASFGCCRLNEAWKSAIRSSIDLGLGHGELNFNQLFFVNMSTFSSQASRHVTGPGSLCTESTCGFLGSPLFGFARQFQGFPL